MKVWLPTVRAGSGADVFSDRLAAGLRRAGCDCEITWFGHGHELLPAAMRARIPKGVDVIHANSWSAFAFCGMGVPVVSTEHGYVRDPEFVAIKTLRQRLYHGAVIGPFVERSMRRADALTAVSNGLAGVVQRDARRIVHPVPNWIDVAQFKETTRPDGRALRVLYVGSSAFHKGFDVVQRIVREKPGNIELHCPIALRRALGEENGVHFYPRLPHWEMPSLYEQCDVVLVPSRYEGFGYVACEALASARPVVGFACSALREVCGVDAAELHDVGDVEGVIGSIVALEANRTRIDEMGHAGRSRVRERFTESMAVAAYLDVYSSLVR